jgi:predicted aspartyl protease
MSNVMARAAGAALCLAIALAGGPATAQQNAPLTVAPEQIALKGDVNQRMTVQVELQGIGPYPFLIDTGAERTTISSELASALALRPAGQATIRGMVSSLSAPTYHIDRLDMGRHRADDLRAPALRQTLIGAPGLIGADALQHERITLDFRRRTMTIGDAPLRPGPADRELLLLARKIHGRLVIVNAVLDEAPVAVILDTGSQVSIGNDALRDHLFRRRVDRESKPIELIDVIGGRVPAIYTRTRTLEFAPFRIKKMPIALAQLPIFAELGLVDEPALLLGMDVLSMFDQVAIDFDKRTARFLAPQQL